MQSSSPANARSRTFFDRDGYYISDALFTAPSLSYRIDAITSARVVRERISRRWMAAAFLLALAAGGLWLRIGLVPGALVATPAMLALVRALWRRRCLDLRVHNNIKIRLWPESPELLHAVAEGLNQAMQHRQAPRPGPPADRSVRPGPDGRPQLVDAQPR